MGGTHLSEVYGSIPRDLTATRLTGEFYLCLMCQFVHLYLSHLFLALSHDPLFFVTAPLFPSLHPLTRRGEG